MKSDDLPTADQVRSLLDYDEATGIFKWKAYRAGNAKVGMIAGRSSTNGYRQICIMGRMHMAHRLAWLLVHGTWPSSQLDHVNGDRSDNRIVNLRLATQADNTCNTRLRSDSTSMFKGVSWHKGSKRWHARIGVRGKTKYLGSFKSAHDAHAAYCSAALLHFGEFARFG